MFFNMTSIKGEQEINNEIKFINTEQKYRVTEQTEDLSYNLVAAAIEHGLILIGLPEKMVVGVRTMKLLKSQTIPDLNNVLFTFQLSFEPTLLSVSQHGFGTILLVGGKNKEKNCPVVQFFNLDTRESIAMVELVNQINCNITESEWNPIYHDSIVVLCTSSGSLLVIAVSMNQKRAAIVYQDLKYGVQSCSWSPKGKNLAIGMSNGQIMRLEPDITESSFTFKDVSNSAVIPVNESLSEQHRIVKLDWIKKKTLLCIHAKPNDPDGPDAVYSLVSIKPTDPLIYWSNVCSHRFDSNYSFYSVNLSNIIISASSCSSEVAVFGPKCGEPTPDKIPDWSSVTIDEEGCRIDLPRDSQYGRTCALGMTVTLLGGDTSGKPILVFYTSPGVISCYVCDSTIELDLPTLLEPEECPIEIPKPIVKEPTPPVPQVRSQENGKPYTIKEEEDGDDGLDLPITPLKSCPRESISQWSVERMKRNMSVKSLVSSMEKQRR